MSPLVMIGIIVFAVALMFSSPFRHRVGTLFQGVGCGLRGVWGIVWRIILAALVIAGVVYAGTLLVGWLTGVFAKSSTSGLLIGLFLLPWLISLAIPRQLPVVGNIARVSTWILTPVMLIAFFNLGVGLLSPGVKVSWNRFAENKKREVANFLDKQSVQTEAESGKFARVKRDAVLFNSNHEPITEVRRGQHVMILDLAGVRATADSEGLVAVMLPNRGGLYAKGQKGYLPARFLDWESNETPSPDPKRQIQYHQQQMKETNPPTKTAPPPIAPRRPSHTRSATDGWNG